MSRVKVIENTINIMQTLTPDEKIKAMRMLITAVVETCQASEPFGAPGGLIYSALSTKGFTLIQYEELMAGLVRAGLLKRSGECYRSTGKFEGQPLQRQNQHGVAS